MLITRYKAAQQQQKTCYAQSHYIIVNSVLVTESNCTESTSTVFSEQNSHSGKEKNV